jgi:hypothetical protein
VTSSPRARERFDLVKFELLLERGPQAAREDGYRAACYISYRDVQTLAEYVARLHASEPDEDSR